MYLIQTCLYDENFGLYPENERAHAAGFIREEGHFQKLRAERRTWLSGWIMSFAAGGASGIFNFQIQEHKLSRENSCQKWRKFS